MNIPIVLISSEENSSHIPFYVVQEEKYGILTLTALFLSGDKKLRTSAMTSNWARKM